MAQKPNITTVDQLREHDPAPCALSLRWLAENGITELADAWDRYHRGGWLLWLDCVLNLLDDRERRMIACRLVRETPLADGRKVWDLLEDEGRQAVAVAERYATGEATDEELAAAHAAAEYAAYATVGYAAEAAALAAARAAAARADAADTAAAATAAVARATLADTADEDAAFAAEEAAVDAADTAVADIVRAIAGNPFRPA